LGPRRRCISKHRPAGPRQSSTSPYFLLCLFLPFCCCIISASEGCLSSARSSAGLHSQLLPAPKAALPPAFTLADFDADDGEPAAEPDILLGADDGTEAGTEGAARRATGGAAMGATVGATVGARGEEGPEDSAFNGEEPLECCPPCFCEFFRRDCLC